MVEEEDVEGGSFFLELLLGQAMLAYARAQPEAHSAGTASSGVDEAEVREQQEEHACDHIERALILTEGSLGAETEGTRERSIAVSCYRELGLHAGFHARYAEAAEYLSKAVELDASDAEAQFQLATAQATWTELKKVMSTTKSRWSSGVARQRQSRTSKLGSLRLGSCKRRKRLERFSMR